MSSEPERETKQVYKESKLFSHSSHMKNQLKVLPEEQISLLNNLKHHLLVHPQKAHFQSTFCSNVYLHKMSVKSGIQNHIEEHPNICTVCAKLFSH